METTMILVQQNFWSGITIGFIYALIALGFNIIFNVSKILNIAHGEFVMVGALCIYTFVSVLHVPIWLAFIFTIFISLFMGWMMVKIAIAPLKKPVILTLIVVTVAFGEIIKGLSFLVWGSDYYDIPSFLESKSVKIFSANVDTQTFLIIGATLAIYFGFSWMNKNTYFGKRLTAISGDPYAAELMGINVKRMLLLVVMIGTMMGAVAGVLAGPLTTMSYTQGTMLGIKAFIAALLGGLGSYGGAIIGGITLGLFEAYAAGFLSSLFKDAFAFTLLLILLVFLPNGLVQIKNVFQKRLRGHNEA